MTRHVGVGQEDVGPSGLGGAGGPGGVVSWSGPALGLALALLRQEVAPAVLGLLPSVGSVSGGSEHRPLWLLTWQEVAVEG